MRRAAAESAAGRAAGAAADDEPGLDHGYRRQEGRLIDPAYGGLDRCAVTWSAGGSAPPGAAGSPAPRRPSAPAPASRPGQSAHGDRYQLTGNVEPGGDVGHRGLAHTISCCLPPGSPRRGPGRLYSRGTPRVPRIARPGANVPRLLSAAEKLAISLQVSDTIRMGDQRPRPEADRILVAQLTGEARHRARWRPLTEDEEAAALAEIRTLAKGRADLLAQVAGIFEGTSEGEPDEPLARSAARLCRLAGADTGAIPAWIEEGRRRSANARRPPFSGGLS